MAAASAAASAFRTRSGLLIIDILMLPIVGLTLALVLDEAWEVGTWLVLVSFAPWFALITLAVPLAAGAAQVCLGRLELRRGHLLLSTIGWGGMLVFVAGGLLVGSRSVANVTPADLRLPHGAAFSAPRSGERFFVGGPTTRWGPAFQPGFLYERDGSYSALRGLEPFTQPIWSSDGRSVAWASDGFPFLEVTPEDLQRWIWYQAPGQLEAPVQLPLRRDAVEVVALSPSGARLLISSWDGYETLAVPAGDTIAKASDRRRWQAVEFVSETEVRLLAVDPGFTTVVTWDMETGTFSEHGRFEMPTTARPAAVWPTLDWRRIVRSDDSGLHLYGLEGKTVGVLVDGWEGARNRYAGPLSGGRIGSLVEEGATLRIRAWDADGRLLSDGRFPGQFPAIVGSEIRPGVVAVGISDAWEFGLRETVFYDVAAGVEQSREAGLGPVFMPWFHSDRGLSPGSTATRLFRSEAGIVKLDPGSGERTVVIARRGRSGD